MRASPIAKKKTTRARKPKTRKRTRTRAITTTRKRRRVRTRTRPQAAQLPSWPGLSRPSTSFLLERSKDVDARHKAGHDELERRKNTASIRVSNSSNSNAKFH